MLSSTNDNNAEREYKQEAKLSLE